MLQKRIAEIADDYSEAVEKDYIGLWQIVIRVRYEFGTTDQVSNKRIVLDIVKQMLSAGLEAITLEVSGPVRWQNQESGYVLNRISSEWDSLDHDPNPGDIVWFDRTRNP